MSLGDEVDDQSTEKKKPIKLAEPSTANTYNSGEPEMSSQKKINFQSLDNFENISGFNAEESAKKESSKLIQEVFKDYSEKGAEKNLRTLLEYVSLEHLITFCCLIKEMCIDSIILIT